MSLEDKLHDAVAKGLTHVTLFAVPSSDGKKTYWAARAAPSTGHHYVETNDVDAVKALSTCLDNLPKARRRAAIHRETLTATVTDEPPPTEDASDGSISS